MKSASKWLENAISSIRNLDSEIHRIETRILDQLLEIERRKSYCELKYDGLFSFCIKEFRWSESQAYSRIQAMRAMQTVPEVKSFIDQGKMSVTTVAQVQVFLRQEAVEAGIRRTSEERLQVFESFQDKSAKQVKQEIAELKGERLRQKLLIELDEEGEALWSEVRGRSAHQNRGSELNCLKLLMKNFLEQLNQEATKTARRSSSGLTQESPGPSDPVASIPQALRRQIFARDQHQCQNCGSRHALEVDHITPRACGGQNTLDNLRVLCRNCNLQHGVRQFGVESMKRTARSI